MSTPELRNSNSSIEQPLQNTSPKELEKNESSSKKTSNKISEFLSKHPWLTAGVMLTGTLLLAGTGYLARKHITKHSSSNVTQKL